MTKGSYVGRWFIALAIGLVATSATGLEVGAQGVQTGELTGIVKDSSGGDLPGVTITVTSPSLQGSRAGSKAQRTHDHLRRRSDRDGSDCGRLK